MKVSEIKDFFCDLNFGDCFFGAIEISAKVNQSYIKAENLVFLGLSQNKQKKDTGIIVCNSVDKNPKIKKVDFKFIKKLEKSLISARYSTNDYYNFFKKELNKICIL